MYNLRTFCTGGTILSGRIPIRLQYSTGIVTDGKYLTSLDTKNYAKVQYINYSTRVSSQLNSMVDALPYGASQYRKRKEQLSSQVYNAGKSSFTVLDTSRIAKKKMGYRSVMHCTPQSMYQHLVAAKPIQ